MKAKTQKDRVGPAGARKRAVKATPPEARTVVHPAIEAARETPAETRSEVAGFPVELLRFPSQLATRHEVPGRHGEFCRVAQHT